MLVWTSRKATRPANLAVGMMATSPKQVVTAAAGANLRKDEGSRAVGRVGGRRRAVTLVGMLTGSREPHALTVAAAGRKAARRPPAMRAKRSRSGGALRALGRTIGTVDRRLPAARGRGTGANATAGAAAAARGLRDAPTGAIAEMHRRRRLAPPRAPPAAPPAGLGTPPAPLAACPTRALVNGRNGLGRLRGTAGAAAT